MEQLVTFVSSGGRGLDGFLPDWKHKCRITVKQRLPICRQIVMLRAMYFCYKGIPKITSNLIGHIYVQTNLFHLLVVVVGIAVLILGSRPAKERRRYKVTPSLIGWAQTKNQLCLLCAIKEVTRMVFSRISFHRTPSFVVSTWEYWIFSKTVKSLIQDAPNHII